MSTTPCSTTIGSRPTCARFSTVRLGQRRAEQYFELFEELRAELGYADYLGALQRYRSQRPYDSHVLSMSPYLIDYPFAERLFPGCPRDARPAARA